jgi:hypothetical protein
MVFDTKTLDSFSALAGIIGEYNSPSQIVLEQKQQDQACRLRKEFGWHARHIAEALGFGPVVVAERYAPKVLEAIEGCTTRGGWGGAEIDARRPRPTLEEGPLRDRLNLRGRAARDRLTEEEATLEGTNRFGEVRTTARSNAIVEAALRPEILPFYGEGGRKAGYKKTSAELAAEADIIIRDQKRAGHYPGLNYRKLSNQTVLAVIKDLVATGLFTWEGSRRARGIEEMPVEERAKVDAEILRRAREQAKLTPYRPPKGFYTELERDIHKTFPCCGPDGTETMDKFGWSPFTQSYANRTIGAVKPPIFSGPVGIGSAAEAAIDDPENIKAVKEAIGDSKELAHSIIDIRRKTGLTRTVVEVILKNLGYMSGADHVEAVRKIILPFHDNEKLTVPQMWDKSPELRRLLTGETDPPKPKIVRTASGTRPVEVDKVRLRGIQRIRGFLVDSTPPRVPWTGATLEAELGEAENQRRTPLVVERLRAGIVGFVHSMESQRSFGRLFLAVPPVQDLAKGLNESESLITAAIQLLLAEPSPIIQMIDGVVQVPSYTQLRIQRGDVSRWEFSAN